VTEHIYKRAFVGLSHKYKTFISGVNILKQIYILCTEMCQYTNAQFQNMNLKSKSDVILLILFLFSFLQCKNQMPQAHSNV